MTESQPRLYFRLECFLSDFIGCVAFIMCGGDVNCCLHMSSRQVM